jgi:adenylate cyclase
VLARALGAAGDRDAAARELEIAAEGATAAEARLIRGEAEEVAESLGVELPSSEATQEAEDGSDVVELGERLVTSLFADVRGYAQLIAAEPPAELSERMGALFRFARTAVERQGGVVDKFAGDAVMATFNVTGTRVDHCVSALEAALVLRDRAAAMDLAVGIGLAVGPALLARGSSQDNLTVRGVATNLASRLQGKAGKSEILLSEEAYRRVESWLAQRDQAAEREEFELKGFEGPQIAFRIAAPPS